MSAAPKFDHENNGCARLWRLMGWDEIPEPPTASNRTGPRPLPSPPPLSRDARAMRRRRVALAAMRRAVRRET